jgi:hypothetical protein
VNSQHASMSRHLMPRHISPLKNNSEKSRYFFKLFP